jgi:hypothetical protein
MATASGRWPSALEDQLAAVLVLVQHEHQGLGVDQHPAPGHVLTDPIGRQQGQDPPVRAEQLGAGPVALPQPQEVRRVAAEPGQQFGHEGVLVGGGQELAVAAFGADGGALLAPAGAAQNDPAPWVGYTVSSSGSGRSRWSDW